LRDGLPYQDIASEILQRKDRDIAVKSLATADKVMGEAAQLLDFQVAFFG
jgi:hypothetical protein